MARSPWLDSPWINRWFDLMARFPWLDPPWLDRWFDLMARSTLAQSTLAHCQTELLAPFGVKSTAGQEYDVENRRVTNYGEIAGQAAYFSVRNIF